MALLRLGSAVPRRCSRYRTGTIRWNFPQCCACPRTEAGCLPWSRPERLSVHRGGEFRSGPTLSNFLPDHNKTSPPGMHSRSAAFHRTYTFCLQPRRRRSNAKISKNSRQRQADLSKSGCQLTAERSTTSPCMDIRCGSPTPPSVRQSVRPVRQSTTDASCRLAPAAGQRDEREC